MTQHKIAEMIGKVIGYRLVDVAFPAGLFALMWNNVIADTFDAAHFNYWIFFVVCLGIHYLVGNKSAK